MTRTGLGFDSHRFQEGRPLVLGGHRVPGATGLSGHSDADVLAHAVVDALLGSAALGDIGRHFPDEDPQWKDAPGELFVGRALQMLAERGLRLLHLDSTIVAETPRLAPHIEDIRGSLAGMLGLPREQVSVKASSNEGMGAIGRSEGMAALALATVGDLDD